jgi:ABC-2 type transport system permease protein
MAMRAARAIGRRAFADSRARNLSFALLFLLVAYANTAGYRHSYSTLHERINFARSFGDDKAARLFYGTPHDLVSVGGYAGWRVAGLASIFTAMWGILAAVRALRAEEESGRAELVLAGGISRGGMFAANLAAILGGAAVLWLALFLGSVSARLPAGGSAYLALAAVSPAAVFAGLGTLVSQLLPTRRLATEVASAVLMLALVLRVVADTSSSLHWLRWATPLGWAEELRPFADSRPLVLLLPAACTALLLAGAAAIAVRRDVGNGVFTTSDSAAPRLSLLSSPTAEALRGARGSLIGWSMGIGFFALIVGLSANEFSPKNISASAERQLHKVGGATLVTPAGALSFYFLFFVLAISLFVCSQIAAARREEGDQRLETLFALPVSRRRWLAGRLAIAGAAATVVACVAGALAWVGEASEHAGVSLPDLLAAGANCLPASLLFLGLGALAFATLPRASAGTAYGIVSLAFVWELFGALLGAPSWTLGISPFHQVGLVPDQPFRATAAVLMLVIGAAAMVAGVLIFERRDLAGS